MAESESLDRCPLCGALFEDAPTALTEFLHVNDLEVDHARFLCAVNQHVGRTDGGRDGLVGKHPGSMGDALVES